MVFLIRQLNDREFLPLQKHAPGHIPLYCDSQTSVFEDIKIHDTYCEHQISLLLEVCHLFWLMYPCQCNKQNMYLSIMLVSIEA